MMPTGSHMWGSGVMERDKSSGGDVWQLVHLFLDVRHPFHDLVKGWHPSINSEFKLIQKIHFT